MKARGWRVALTAAAIGLALVVALVAFNWATVRDHAEAWWFVATRETREVEPPEPPYEERFMNVTDVLIQALANESKTPVIYQPLKLPSSIGPMPTTVKGTDSWLMTMRGLGYRVIDQRFPRRAYVVVGYPTADSAR